MESGAWKVGIEGVGRTLCEGTVTTRWDVKPTSRPLEISLLCRSEGVCLLLFGLSRWPLQLQQRRGWKRTEDSRGTIYLVRFNPIQKHPETKREDVPYCK